MRAQPKRRIKVVADAAALSLAAAEIIVGAAAEAIVERGRFSIVLSGGDTPRGLYRLLASDEWAARIEWPKVHVYFSDERCVAPDDPDSNFGMACQTMLDHVPIPYEHIYRMRGELDAKAAASAYDGLLKEAFGEDGADLAILGMGEDGHTASLFPQAAALNEKLHRCVATDDPHSGQKRLTMTAPFLNRSQRILFLVSGSAKAQRLQEVLQTELDPQRLPIHLIDTDGSRGLWLMDAAAVEM